MVVPAGSAVNVLSCDGWCEVVYNGKKGWVYKNFLSGSKAKPAEGSQGSQFRGRADDRSATGDAQDPVFAALTIRGRRDTAGFDFTCFRLHARRDRRTG